MRKRKNKNKTIIMITCSGLLRRYFRWFFVFLICFLIQVLLIVLFYQIEETTEFKNLIQFNSRLNKRINSSSHSNQNNALDNPKDDLKNNLVNNPKVQLIDEQTSNSIVNEDCETNDSFLISAIERARTQLCKYEIKNVFCLHQNDQLYPIELINPNECPSTNLFEHVGCYLNNKRPSIINSLVFQFKKANELRCSYLCSQYNSKYFGIENATFCHCLDRLPSKLLQIDAKLCNMFCDPKTKSYRCGNEYLISMYKTNIEQNEDEFYYLGEEDEKSIGQTDPIRISFIFSVNGRSIRQIKRLIKQLYDKKHVYLIHVDKQNDFLFNFLSDELSELPNLIVTNQRFYTIWGGSQLLEMLLNSFKILKKFEWDFVINLSETDYPIKSLSSLEHYLKKFKGKNFLKFHGQMNDAFIRKQGLEVLFLQCENRMWRLNKQRNLPKSISFTGGSDWFALHCSFVDYLIDNSTTQHNSTTVKNEFVSSLIQFFNHTLLPAESFFHTVLQNSEFCSKVINNNLRITNWKRKSGCKCQYKHIVDWCGCSPNIYLEQDWPKLESTFDKPLFFARKFDPLVDHNIINQIELSYNPSSSSQPNFNKYWHSEFDFKYDRNQFGNSKTDRISLIQTAFSQLSIIALKELISNCSNYYAFLDNSLNLMQDTIALSNVHTLINRGEYTGTQIAFNFTQANRFELTHLKFDFLVLPKHYFKQQSFNEFDNNLELISLKVCTDYDIKEDLFRNFGCLMNSRSQLIVQHKWRYLSNRLPANYTIDFVWIHSSDQIIFRDQINLTDLLSNSNLDNKNDKKRNLKIASFHLKTPINRPIKTGIWKLLIIDFQKKSLLDKSSKTSKVLSNSNIFDKLYKLIDELNNDKLQSRLIAETRFLILEQNKSNKEDQLEQLRQFWKIKDICLNDEKLIGSSFNECKLTIKNCLNTSWSSILADPKSDCC